MLFTSPGPERALANTGRKQSGPHEHRCFSMMGNRDDLLQRQKGTKDRGEKGT